MVCYLMASYVHVHQNQGVLNLIVRLLSSFILFYVNFKLKHVYWSNNAFNTAWPFGIVRAVYH